MTAQYANLKPQANDSHAISGEVAVLKWSHSIVEEYNFINEFAAIENARSLAFELGTYDGISCATTSATLTHMAPSPRRSLGFASDVDVLMGLADELTMYKITVPDVCLGNGIMPWSAGLLRGGEFSNTNFDFNADQWQCLADHSPIDYANGENTAPPVAAATMFPSAGAADTNDATPGPGHHGTPRGEAQMPSWGQNILQLLEEEGEVSDEDEGPVIMVSSFFIDHETHRFHDEPRILRFDQEYQEWEADVRFIWEDMIDNQASLDIVIVRPEPPHIPFRGTVATVIVHQHQRADRAACLITAVHIMDPVTTFRHSAHSTDLLLPHAQVRHLAGVEQICLQRELQGTDRCTVHIGHQLQPDDQDLAIFHGLSVHIRIPSSLSIEEAEQNLCRRVQQQRLQRQGNSWDPPDVPEGPPEADHPRPDPTGATGPSQDPEDAISLMGRRPHRPVRRQPIEVSSTSNSPETVSSTERGLDWRQTVIFTLDGLSTSAQLPWSDPDALFGQIAAALNFGRRNILRVVAVPHRPLDYEPVQLHCMLLQRSTEFRPSPYVRLILVDRELHVEQTVQPSPFRRFPTWIPHILTRAGLLNEFGLSELCEAQGQPCHVWRNNVLIEEQATENLYMADGDYVRIFVGDLPNSETCMSDHESAEEEMITNDTEEVNLFQKAMRNLKQDFANLLHKLEPATCKVAPDHVTTGRPIGLPSTTRQDQRPAAPTQEFHQGDLQRLRNWFDRDALIECSDEGEIAYINTWYIHHQQQAICREARPFRLGADPTSWRTDILELWQDIIDPNLATTIHLVQPPPPCAMTECVLAHLILEQSTRPQHGVGLITIHVRDRHGDSTRHGAYSLPNIMTERNVLHLAEMFMYCQARLCAVRLGALPFGLADWVEIPRAASLVIHIRPLILPQDDDDPMELMQRSRTRWRREPSTPANDVHAPNDGLATSSTSRRCARFVFNPGAPAFNPMTPNLNTMSEEIQELHQHWIRTAFSWEGETASTRIQTWFVDQHDQNFWTCNQPRTVRLYEDYTQWEAQIRQTWQDLLNPAAPSIIQVVTPTPINTHRETAAHVLLIQRPHEVFATVLTTVVDLSHARRAITMQLAITTHEHMYVQNLLMALGLAGRCLVSGAAMTCQTWYDRFLIQPGTVFPARNGQGLLIQMHRRPTYQDMRDGTNLLQTRMQVIHRERQTHGQVAHTHGPRSDTSMHEPTQSNTMSVGCDLSPVETGIVYIHWPPTFRSSTQVPQFVEVEQPGAPEQVQQELRCMGYEGEVFPCGQHDAVYFHPRIYQQEMMHIYCNQDTTVPNGIHIHRGPPAEDDITHMRILYQKGYHKAVIVQREIMDKNVAILHFRNVEPQQDQEERLPRQRSPWPDKQPLQINMTRPYTGTHIQGMRPDHILELDCQALYDFFMAPQITLIKDVTEYEVPEFIRQALHNCKQLDRHDRMVIYTDGSSQSRKRHCSPLWTDLHDTSDSWCFAVFAEQYADLHDDDGPHLEFIGLTCQQILYEPDRHHHVGTDHIGSDAAETEALLWSALWRIAQNHRLPTVFVSDSQLVGGQASGKVGSNAFNEPFRHLRAAFQALEAILPGDHLRIAHTRSHAGEPYNELVDHFAKLEAKHSLYLQRQQVNMSKFGGILGVLWMILSQDKDVPQLCQGGLALTPPQMPPQGQSDSVNEITSCTSEVSITLSFATANVRTFYRGQEGVPGKLHYIRNQFKNLHLHFLGLQETRTKKGSSATEAVLRLASGDCQGQQGVELWLNLEQPYGWCRGKPLCFARSHIVVTHTNSRYIIAHVLNDHLDFWIAVAYAPQSGIAHQIREEWWHDFGRILHEATRGQDVVVMLDANAATGNTDEQHIFQYDDKTTSGTLFLRELLATHNLCLPATSACHQGDQDTWICPATDKGHRIDYVAIPTAWRWSCTLSRTIPELDLGNIGDHTAVGLEVQWKQFTTSSIRHNVRPVKYDREAILQCPLQDLLLEYTPLDWSADIARQVDHCNGHLQRVMQKHCPRRRSGPKKSFITDEIWQMRLQKIQTGRQVRQLRRLQHRELQARVFHTWKRSATVSPGEDFNISLWCTRLKLDIKYQLTTDTLRRRLKQARGQALQDAIAALPTDAHSSTILQTLKPIIGPTNLKHKRESPLPIVHDEEGRPCSNPQELLDRWVNFFGAMEGGIRMDKEQLYQQWRTNLHNFVPEQLCLRPEDIPTLVDLERAYRRVRPGKATGADNIPPELCHGQPTTLARLTFTQLLKLTAHGQESLTHKGGLLVSAWKKKGAQHECSSYRSLLISSHVGKTLHRALRETQSSLYEQFLQQSQLGGRKKVPVGLGVHHVRASLRRAKERRASSALIFLDLQEAFYRVIRPLAVGGHLTDDVLGQVAQRLSLDHDVLHDLHQLLQTPSATAMAGLPAHLQNALPALHTDTHFWMAGQTDYVRTAVGTRPGDPFADVVFGYMFARILKTVEAQMMEAELVEAFSSPAGAGLFNDAHQQSLQFFLGPTWMDDLCITLSAQNAQNIELQASTACGILLDACRRHGVTPNLQKGKSEVLFAFRGKGARALRQKYFGPNSSGKLHVLTEDGSQHLSVVGQYQHLGGLVHHSGETRQEMRKRVAQGHAAFTHHRRELYHNCRLSIDKRSELFQTMVASKILYGTESWTLRDKTNKHYFHSAYMRLYRRVLKLPHTQQITDEEILTQLQLPSPTTVLRVARLRYVALLYKCEHATPWAVVRADTGWLELVKDDLQWLWRLVCSTTKLPDPTINFAPWENVLRYHRTYWKRLLQRATKLEVLHIEDQTLLLRLHREAFQHLEETGPLAYRPQQYQRAPDQDHQVFGCMQCSKRFRSHGGEGAHLCRAHGIIAPIRWLYNDTVCPACLREYHTFAKLQQHLRCTTACRHLLQGQRRCPVPAPGKGSFANEQLHQRHDGLMPPVQAQGPHDERQHPQDDDRYHLELYETVVTYCFDHQDHPDRDLFDDLRDKIMEHAVGWTMTKRTLHHIADALTEEDAQLAQMNLDNWRQILYRLADYRNWSFLREDFCEPADPQALCLDHYENWCHELMRYPCPRLTKEQIPRVHFQERVIVHAYSGRRRPGDFQWFLEAVATRKNLNLLFVVSLDLVIDQEWGDISKPATYNFWMHSIRSGYVQGVLGGPPCCTWSAARGKVDEQMKQQGRTGPRPIRSAMELWGFWSLSLKEKRQILDGHRLLAFSILCMVLLEQVDGAGVLEHPSEPKDPQSPSIWKLPLIEMLLQIPGFDKIIFAQGLLGADSSKSTTLLVLNLPNLLLDIRKHAISAELPHGRSIGLDKQGHFKTSVLKEYPPALCSALAASFADFLHDSSSPTEGRHPLPVDVKERLSKMVCHTFGTSIGPDCAQK